MLLEILIWVVKNGNLDNVDDDGNDNVNEDGNYKCNSRFRQNGESKSAQTALV